MEVTQKNDFVSTAGKYVYMLPFPRAPGWFCGPPILLPSAYPLFSSRE